MSTDDIFKPLRKGLLELAVLHVIGSGDPVYAGEIIARLNETEFATQEGTLYPLLSRMRRDGVLDYEWVESDSGPPRKYYLLTAAGRERLSSMREYFDRIGTTFDTLGKQS